MQEPTLKSEALPEPNAKAFGVCLSSHALSADAWGMRMGLFSQKFQESFAKERAKAKMHFEGDGPERLAKKIRNQQLFAMKNIPCC